jgi:hypothetical protein
MKTVWVICETIDLGYRMVKGYESYDKANAECQRMDDEAKAEKVKDLMKHCDYTKEQADSWCVGVCFYDLDSVEIEE